MSVETRQQAALVAAKAEAGVIEILASTPRRFEHDFAEIDGGARRRVLATARRNRAGRPFTSMRKRADHAAMLGEPRSRGRHAEGCRTR